jgi:hypothetical protein
MSGIGLHANCKHDILFVFSRCWTIDSLLISSPRIFNANDKWVQKYPLLRIG